MGSAREPLLDALDAALRSLVQRAPLGSPAELARAGELALELALDSAGDAAGPVAADVAKLSAERTDLACAIERCLELIGEGLVDPGVALPALAMAAHGARMPSLPAVAAARYEVETLLPIPGKATAIKRSVDVPAASLARRPLRVGGDGGKGGEGGEPAASAPRAAGAGVALHRLEALWSAHPEAAVSRVQAARQRLRA